MGKLYIRVQHCACRRVRGAQALIPWCRRCTGVLGQPACRVGDLPRPSARCRPDGSPSDAHGKAFSQTPDPGERDANSRADVQSFTPTISPSATIPQMTSSHFLCTPASAPTGVTTPPKPFHAASELAMAGSGVDRTRMGRSRERSSAAPAAEAKKADGSSWVALPTPIPPQW